MKAQPGIDPTPSAAKSMNPTPGGFGDWCTQSSNNLNFDLVVTALSKWIQSQIPALCDLTPNRL